MESSWGPIDIALIIYRPVNVVGAKGMAIAIER
jgi:hypothetical protein